MKRSFLFLALTAFLIGSSLSSKAQIIGFGSAPCVGFGNSTTHTIEIVNNTSETQNVSVQLVDVMNYNSSCEPLFESTCNNAPFFAGAVTVAPYSTMTTTVQVNQNAQVAVHYTRSCTSDCGMEADCGEYYGYCSPYNGSLIRGKYSCYASGGFYILPNILHTIPATSTTSIAIF